MFRSMQKTMFVLGALVVGMSAANADAAVIVRHHGVAVVARPFVPVAVPCGVPVVYPYSVPVAATVKLEATVARPVPYAPYVAPEIVRYGHAEIVRRW